MKKTYNSYKKSGVNISLGNKFVKYVSSLSKKNVQKTNKSLSKDIIGGFGSLYDISKIKIKDQVLVSCTDGVGTKVDLANKFKKFDKIGIDLVAMCVNDLIVQGAKPLFFLDYIAVGKLNLNKTKKILKGVFEGCRLANCQLVGGETAEMPGIYIKNNFDLAGFSVGIVSKKKLLDKNKVKIDHSILAVPSNGIHSNGYSLVRSILKRNRINSKIKKELIKPTKIYVKEVLKLVDKGLIVAAANITGGGIVENLLRSIPDELSLKLDLSKIKVGKIFKWLRSKNISDQEMLNTFNCGVGFCLICPSKNINKIKKFFEKEYQPYEIGKIINGKERYKLINSFKW